jgi:hypothetical protein
LLLLSCWLLLIQDTVSKVNKELQHRGDHNEVRLKAVEEEDQGELDHLDDSSNKQNNNKSISCISSFSNLLGLM